MNLEFYNLILSNYWSTLFKILIRYELMSHVKNNCAEF